MGILRSSFGLILRKTITTKVISGSLLLFLWTLISGYLISKYSKIKTNENIEFFSDELLFFMVVFAAPIIETLLFQFLPYYLLNEKLKFYNKWILILTSGVLFGITHGNDIIIWMFSTVAGFMLMAWFIHFKKFSTYSNTFFLVCLIHSLSNLYVYIIKAIE